MLTRYFALVVGIVYLLVGVMGFIGGFVQPPAAGDPELVIGTLYGRLLGLFPINILHNIVHLAIGAWGIYAYRSWGDARIFARGLTIFYGLLAIMGFIPFLNTTFGLIPIFGHDIWLHALTALVAAYFGWMAPDESRAGAVDARRLRR